MAGEVVVDALPYIDQGYDEAGVRETALAMVDEETRRYRPTKNYLEHLPPLNTTLFETEMMKSEWERMQQRQPMDVLSMKRYELPPPPAGKMTDIAAWTECVENSHAQLEHQATRICNLELMLEYGPEAWRSYLELIVASVTQNQKIIQAMRKDIQEINWERKNVQMKAGEKLRELEATWVGLVSKNYDIEQACVTVEEEIAKLQREKENALKRRRIEEERANAKRIKLEKRERERQLMLEKQEQLRLEQLRQEQLREEELRQEQLRQEQIQEMEEEHRRQEQLQQEQDADVPSESVQENAQESWHQQREEISQGEAQNYPDNETQTDSGDSRGSGQSQDQGDSNHSGGSGFEDNNGAVET